MQEGTHEETPLPVVSVMDGAAGFLAEASMGFGMIEVELMKSEELKLVDSEAQFPRDICPPDGEGIVVCWSEGHGIMVK